MFYSFAMSYMAIGFFDILDLISVCVQLSLIVLSVISFLILDVMTNWQPMF